MAAGPPPTPAPSKRGNKPKCANEGVADLLVGTQVRWAFADADRLRRVVMGEVYEFQVLR